jgi:hypothetical protein
MNQPALFKARDDLHGPAGLSLHPGLKGRAVARVAHGRGGHHANLVDAMRLHRALKTLERAQRGRHRFRRDTSPDSKTLPPSRVTSRSSATSSGGARHLWRSSICRSWNRYRWRQRSAWRCSGCLRRRFIAARILAREKDRIANDDLGWVQVGILEEMLACDMHTVN